jgi:hypothetical protein
MKMTLTELKLTIADMISEAKKKAKKEDKIEKLGAQVEAYGFYNKEHDFSAPLGAYNLYRQQGQVNWGPQTSAGTRVDSNVGNPNAIHIKESAEETLRALVREVLENGHITEDSAWSPFLRRASASPIFESSWEEAEHRMNEAFTGQSPWRQQVLQKFLPDEQITGDFEFDPEHEAELTSLEQQGVDPDAAARIMRQKHRWQSDRPSVEEGIFSKTDPLDAATQTLNDPSVQRKSKEWNSLGAQADRAPQYVNQDPQKTSGVMRPPGTMRGGKEYFNNTTGMFNKNQAKKDWRDQDSLRRTMAGYKGSSGAQPPNFAGAGVGEPSIGVAPRYRHVGNEKDVAKQYGESAWDQLKQTVEPMYESAWDVAEHLFEKAWYDKKSEKDEPQGKAFGFEKDGERGHIKKHGASSEKGKKGKKGSKEDKKSKKDKK